IGGGHTASAEFVEGLQLDFIAFHVSYSLIKSLVFAMVIATVPSYHGYYMKGGALEVGKASTTSFVWTSVVIIILNGILTQLLLG
ncbi:MAG: ABC transporter permease, partial [Eudoraea sp.]|nr:ABC transporter permease [Eudoraea sp.]